MNRTEEAIMEMYHKHEKLIGATIYRRYSNPSYMKLHGLTKIDLYQYGRIGLYNACCTYDKSKGASLRNYAIKNIIWSINVESKKDSLSNINNTSNTTINKTSMDSIVPDSEEELTLHDMIGQEDADMDKVEIESLLNSIELNLSPRVANIVKLRIQGDSYEEIGYQLGISKQAVEQKLNRNRNRIISLYTGSLTFN